MSSGLPPFRRLYTFQKHFLHNTTQQTLHDARVTFLEYIYHFVLVLRLEAPVGGGASPIQMELIIWNLKRFLHVSNG